MSSSNGGAPVQDVSFHANKTPRTPWFRRESHDSAKSHREEDHGGSVVSSSTSTGSGKQRRFFPNNLFGAHKKQTGGASPYVGGLHSLTATTLGKRNGGDAIVIRSIKVWDVKMPPMKKHMVKNHLVPTVRGAAGRLFIQKHRRITIEVHGPPVFSHDTASVSNMTSISSMTPMKSGKMQEYLQGGSPVHEDVPLQHKDVVFVRILKLSNDRDDSHSPGDFGDENDDDHSMSTLGPYAPDDNDESFVQQYSYPLEDVEIIRVHGRTCEMKFGSGAETIVRDIKFDAEKQALLFVDCLEDVKRKVQERAKRLAQEYRDKSKRVDKSPAGSPFRSLKSNSKDKRVADGSHPNTYGSMSPQRDNLEVLEEGEVGIRVLVDIVSAIDLPLVDLVSTDAYVTVKLGSKELHRTKHIRNSLNPIWTIDTDSLFLLELSSEEEFFSTSTNGLTFLVKDHDPLGQDDVLGRVVVTHDELLHGSGERIVKSIIPDKTPKKKGRRSNDSRLVLRFRPANEDDANFMRLLRKSSGDVGIYTDETFLPPRSPDSKLLKRMVKHSPQGEVLRVKPFPDPNDPDRTKWMTRKEIETEALKNSSAWIEAGSGNLGKVYVEILGCHNLPNMDTNLNPRDKTDAFACLVYEDVVVNTDVIADSLKPRWMPWSCRAFVFNSSHPQSNLFLGILDYDSATAHDPIGRVTINLGRFSPHTVYDLKLPLYAKGVDDARRKSRGAVSLRIRIEWDLPRKVIMEAAFPPPPMYVSCKKRSHWKVAHFTAGGEVRSAYSISLLSQYVEELQEYKRMTPYVVDAALSLLLWRGSYHTSICGKSIALPIHSVTAFIWGLLISWDFNLFPAFICFAIGWALLAMNQHMRRNPSPWHRPYGYWTISSRLLFSSKVGESIKPNERLQEFQEYKAEVEKKAQKFEEEQKLMQSYDAELREELSGEIASSQAEDVAIHTQKGQLVNSFRPLKSIFYPVQLNLEKLVHGLRIAVCVLKWDEPFFAWWITTSCFLACFVMIWIPWGFFFRWTFRMTVFVFLGPWMAIFDHCFVRKKTQSPEEQANEIRRRVQQRYLQVRDMASTNREKKERAIKLKSWKKYLYGKYLVSVSPFGIDGYPAAPYPESSARPFKGQGIGEAGILDRKYGQNLRGDMIPTREFQVADEVSTEDPVRFPRLAKFWGRRKDDNVTEPLLGESSTNGARSVFESVGKRTGL